MPSKSKRAGTRKGHKSRRSRKSRSHANKASIKSRRRRATHKRNKAEQERARDLLLKQQQLTAAAVAAGVVAAVSQIGGASAQEPQCYSQYNPGVGDIVKSMLPGGMPLADRIAQHAALNFPVPSCAAVGRGASRTPLGALMRPNKNVHCEMRPMSEVMDPNDAALLLEGNPETIEKYKNRMLSVPPYGPSCVGDAAFQGDAGTQDYCEELYSADPVARGNAVAAAPAFEAADAMNAFIGSYADRRAQDEAVRRKLSLSILGGLSAYSLYHLLQCSLRGRRVVARRTRRRRRGRRTGGGGGGGGGVPE